MEMPDGEIAASDDARARTAPGTARGVAGWRRLAVLSLVILVGLGLVGAMLRTASARPATTSAPVETRPLMDGVATLSGAPTGGVLTMVIPRGAAANQLAGGPGYRMPSVISLQVGDRIVLRNDDDAPHMILYAFLKPGQTEERTFTAPGSEVYSSGCGLHAAAFLNFTTIFVRGPA
jgi:hypothetical protein